MENKLIQLIQKFTLSEQRALKDFISSPYFNKNELITKLILAILSQIGHESELQDNYLFEQVWKDEPFDKMKIARLRYKAFLLVEEFILQQTLKNKTEETSLYLLDYYADNNLEKLYGDIYEKRREIQQKQPFRDSHYYYIQFVSDESASRFLTQNQERNQHIDFHEVESHLNVFFIAKKLALACNALGRRSIVHSDFQPDLLAEVIQYIENHPQMLAFPPIKVYFSLYQMLKFPDNMDYFLQFREILAQKVHFFPQKEQKNLHGYVRNHCIAAINKGKSELETLLFHLYDSQLKSGWLFNESGQLLPSNVKNMVVAALRLGETEWVADFLENYQHLIPESQRADTYNYCLAKLFFSQKAHHKTLQLLQNVDFQDVFLNIAARKLLMQTYYELAEWDGLQATLNTFRVFLHRNKTLSESHKLMNRNFANILRKMAEIQPITATHKAELIKIIHATSPLSEKNWLIGKLQ